MQKDKGWMGLSVAMSLFLPTLAHAEQIRNGRETLVVVRVPVEKGTPTIFQQVQVTNAEGSFVAKAGIDAHAIVTLTSDARLNPEAALQALGLVLVRPLMPSAGLYLVQAANADGMAWHWLCVLGWRRRRGVASWLLCLISTGLDAAGLRPPTIRSWAINGTGRA